LIANAKLTRADADAVYQIDETGVDYVPQGNLKRIFFEGDFSISVIGKAHEDFREFTELYVDSVVYLTKDEYKESKKLDAKKRREMMGYTAADIDRLKEKHGVKPLTNEQLERIEQQRDWDEQYAQWKEARKEIKKQERMEKTINNIINK